MNRETGLMQANQSQMETLFLTMIHHHLRLNKNPSSIENLFIHLFIPPISSTYPGSRVVGAYPSGLRGEMQGIPLTG